MIELRSFALPSYAIFAAMLGVSGLPIYIHAPKFFVDNYGVSLSTLGLSLFFLRLLDFLQDPLLGRIAEKTRKYRVAPVWIAGLIMALGMFGLFSFRAPITPVLWFCLTLSAVFTGFSFLSIKFYAQGVSSFGESGQLRLARWRETGSLLGICLAAMAPTFLLIFSDDVFSLYAVLFSGLVFIAIVAMQRHWTTLSDSIAEQSLRFILSDRVVRQMLVLAVLNTAPVAVSSMLFLFFVESRLLVPDMAGPLLILFFLAAAISAPVWTFLADRFGARRILFIAMVSAVMSFSYTFFLQTGQVSKFTIICLASGATLGADLTILPAIFARRLASTGARAEIGFGLWNFASKVSLATAAIVVLPVLQFFEFQPGLENSENGLLALSFGYAALPCTLKIFALWMLLRLRLES